MPEGIFKIQEHQDKTLRDSVWELTPDSKLKCIIKGNSIYLSGYVVTDEVKDEILSGIVKFIKMEIL